MMIPCLSRSARKEGAGLVCICVAMTDDASVDACLLTMAFSRAISWAPIASTVVVTTGMPVCAEDGSSAICRGPGRYPWALQMQCFATGWCLRHPNC